MFSQSLVFAAVLLGAPTEPTGPTLEKGLEVRWTGTFSEASFRPGVRTTRLYEVDTRLFVLATGDFGADAVIFTRIFLKQDRKAGELPSGVVRLEMVKISPTGKIQLLPSPADPDNPDPKLRPCPYVQLQALPTSEFGFFFEYPDKPLAKGLIWTRKETDRPHVTWKVTATESFNGYPALKLIGEQSTSGYYSEQIKQAEWHKRETLTVMPTKGFAAKLERVIEKREPGAEELSYRSVLTLEQKGRVIYSGNLFDRRRDETVHAAAFTSMLDRLMASRGREGAGAYESLVKRINIYLSDYAAYEELPYREAVVAVRKRAAAAAKGDLPPAPVPMEIAKEKADPLAIGQAIPDITAPGITTKSTVKLSSLKGKPAVIAYFQPTASSALPLLRMADELNARKLGAIVPLAIGDPSAASKLQEDEKIAIPIFDGIDVYKTHALESTPVLIVIDADGVVRHVSRGWGKETAATIQREFERWAR